jgi:hypothetical protein
MMMMVMMMLLMIIASHPQGSGIRCVSTCSR